MIFLMNRSGDAGASHARRSGWRTRQVAVIAAVIGGVALAITGVALAVEGNAPADATLALGRELFAREWRPNDPRCHGGDGLGPVYNATSCLDCHFLGGPGGGGPDSRNVVLVRTIIAMNAESPLGGTLHPSLRRSASFVFHRYGVDKLRHETWRRGVIRTAERFVLGRPERAAAVFARRNPPPLIGPAPSMPFRMTSWPPRVPGATAASPRSPAGSTA